MKNWKPVDIIIVMFAGAIVFILVAVTLDIVITDGKLNDIASKRMNLVIASIISIVSMYVGAQIQKYKDS